MTEQERQVLDWPKYVVSCPYCHAENMRDMQGVMTCIYCKSPIRLSREPEIIALHKAIGSIGGWGAVCDTWMRILKVLGLVLYLLSIVYVYIPAPKAWWVYVPLLCLGFGVYGFLLLIYAAIDGYLRGDLERWLRESHDFRRNPEPRQLLVARIVVGVAQALHSAWHLVSAPLRGGEEKVDATQSEDQVAPTKGERKDREGGGGDLKAKAKQVNAGCLAVIIGVISYPLYLLLLSNTRTPTPESQFVCGICGLMTANGVASVVTAIIAYVILINWMALRE